MNLRPKWRTTLTSLKGTGEVTVKCDLGKPIDWGKLLHSNTTITCLGTTVPVKIDNVVQTESEVVAALVFTEDNYRTITKAIEEMQHRAEQITGT